MRITLLRCRTIQSATPMLLIGGRVILVLPAAAILYLGRGHGLRVYLDPNNNIAPGGAGSYLINDSAIWGDRQPGRSGLPKS